MNADESLLPEKILLPLLEGNLSSGTWYGIWPLFQKAGI